MSEFFYGVFQVCFGIILAHYIVCFTSNFTFE